MKYQPWVAGLAFFVICLVLGLAEVGWTFANLPTWMWAAAVGAGLLGMAGAFLMKQATPKRSYRSRALIMGIAFGLPMVFINLAFPTNQGNHIDWISLPIWVTAATFFGLIMANVNRRN